MRGYSCFLHSHESTELIAEHYKADPREAVVFVHIIMTGSHDIVGRWKLVNSENFDEYMAEVGVPMFIRMIAANITVTLVIEVNGKEYKCRQESAFNSTELNFVLDEEFEETTPDGRKFRTICTEEDGKIVQRQKAINDSDKDSEITRYLENGRLITIMKSGSVVARREYEKE